MAVNDCRWQGHDHKAYPHQHRYHGGAVKSLNDESGRVNDESGRGESRGIEGIHTPPCFWQWMVGGLHGARTATKLSRSRGSVHADEATRELDASRSERRDTAFVQRCRSLKVLTGAPDNVVIAKANSKFGSRHAPEV